MIFFLGKSIQSNIFNPNRATMVSEQLKIRVLDLWRDPAIGLTGLRRFQEKLREDGIDLRISDIRNMVSTDPSHTLYTYSAGARIWNTIVETGVGDGMQMDLMDMQSSTLQ